MSKVIAAKRRCDYTAPEFTITAVNLHFELRDTATIVTAVSSVKRVLENSDPLFLHGDSLKLVSLSVDGNQWADFTDVEGGIEISGLPDICELTIVTEISPAENLAFEGLYKSGGAFCTQCEAEGFRRITYYLDRPDVSASFTTTIVANKEKYPYLLSNGNRISQRDLDDGLHEVTWKDPYPKPSYLFALVAGDFDLLTDTYKTKSGRDVALELYVDRGNLDRADHAMRSLKNAMKWDEERFDLEYDLDIYMIVAVGFFNMGAMENKGLNVFNDKFVLAKSSTATDKDYLDIEAVIGHEYFHNWTGNRVTCRDWFQLSLKEGLTVFRDQEFSSDLGSRAVNRIHNVRLVRTHQFAEDAGPMSHPIRPEEVIEMNNFYTVTVYEKGAEVIRMLHTIIGEQLFQKGMKLYFERHDGSAATCDDFVAAMEDASGVDLKLFRRWYSQSGTPELTVKSEYDDSEKTLRLTLSQLTPATADQVEKQPLHIPVNMALWDTDGSRIPLVRNGKECGEIIHLTEGVEELTFENVRRKPVLSLLREFSAPVKLHYEYSDEELAFLTVNETNLFARWDASQSLLRKHIEKMVTLVLSGSEIATDNTVIDTFRELLRDTQSDEALIAEIFTLPPAAEIAGWYDTVPVDAIEIVLKQIMRDFARELETDILARYEDCQTETYSIEQSDIAKRSLKNRMLHYLAYSENRESLIVEQYKNADNMTDSIEALSSAVHAELNCSEELLNSFSEQWHGDGLVMDKWFLLQASVVSSSTLGRVERLMNHKSFNFNNPNRVRSLIGGFANHNLSCFHASDGSGYRFLVDQLVRLNSSNPQVAARLIDPLLKLRKYDSNRQQLMKEQLERLSKLPDLAKDLYEKVSKTLATVS